ncbi:hypothetical protein [Streptomyces ficellus]|uniref:hypothetical protein n=1 Tax=Streptomyces ficellus TaxID=1977088 RepID=UPI00142EE833|nr:hypothetical protein [Streptomyces ficellus]
MFPRHTAPGSPIYDELVAEHGDVLGEARALAERTSREADRLLSWDLASFGQEQSE